MKKDIEGLKYYYTDNNYDFAEELDNFDINEENYDINIDDNEKEISRKRNLIVNALSRVGLNISTKREVYLNNGVLELLDTGSTGRGTSSKNDYDFDFILRIDRDTLMSDYKLEELKNKIKEAFPGIEFESKYNIRDQYITIDNEVVKIDISIIMKDDKIGYTTDECVKDRLDSIKKIDPQRHKKVLENIILAKEVLKRAKAYKPKHAGNGKAEGGLGGVGIENWILKYGGSFERAARSFIDAADHSKDFSDFQSKYIIFDFGENHLYDKHNDKYKHDEFVSNNMDKEGYEKTVTALKNYIHELDERRRNKRGNTLR